MAEEDAYFVARTGSSQSETKKKKRKRNAFLRDNLKYSYSL